MQENISTKTDENTNAGGVSLTTRLGAPILKVLEIEESIKQFKSLNGRWPRRIIISYTQFNQGTTKDGGFHSRLVTYKGSSQLCEIPLVVLGDKGEEIDFRCA